MAPNDVATPLPSGLFQPLLKLGQFRSVLLITVLSVLASQVVTALALWATDADEAEIWITGLLIALIVPSVVATCVGLVLVRMVYALDAARRQVHTLAITDALTGAFNRRHFLALADTAFRQTQQHGGPVSVLMIDVDHFKRINDQFGHLAGDEALKVLTRALGQALRAGDVLARWGGEEFAVLLPATPPEAALQMAQAIRQDVSGLVVTVSAGLVVRITISVGVASRTFEDVTLDKLLSEADHALYRAKSGGRDRVEIASSRTLETIGE